jgi:LPXTG-motif cell wall-anchored protein
MIARYAVAAVVAAVGLIFIGQGLGYIGGSSMTSQPFWAVVGAVMLVAAALLAWRTRRSTRA